MSKTGVERPFLWLKAIDAGYKVSFNTALGLIETLELAELKGELKKMINQLLKIF